MKSMKVLKSLLVLGLLCSANGYVVKAEEEDANQVENLPSSQGTNGYENVKVASGSDTETTELIVIEREGKVNSYSSLKEAIDDVKDGETIKLNGDINDAVGIAVPSGKNFTIDFGGYTYTLAGAGAGSAGTETNGFQLLKDSTIVMKNGTINVKENPVNIRMIIQNYADLTLEDMTIDPTNKLSAGTEYVEDYALSINNGEIHFKGNTNIFASNEDVIAFDIYKFGDYPSVKVTFDDDYTGTIDGTILFDSPNADTHKLEINGKGTFGKIKTTNETAAKSGISVNSGTFASVDVLDYLSEGADVKIKLSENVDESIVIPANTKVNLDLNGKTITNTADQHTITNNGELTIVGEGTVDNTSHARGALVNNGIAAIKGGKFTRSQEKGSSPTESGGNSWYVIQNKQGGTMTFDGGEVTSTSQFSSLVDNYGTMTINDGTFSNGFIAIKSEEDTTLDIKGGTITGAQSVQTYGTTTISDGNLNGQVSVINWETYPSSTIITGGTITGDVVAWLDSNESKVAVNFDGNAQVNGGLKVWNHEKEEIEENANVDMNVESGSFSTNVVKYANPAVASVGVDGTYYVGTKEEMQEKAKDATTTVEVIQGITELDDIPADVTVKNETGADIIVNDKNVGAGEETVTKPDPKPDYRPSGGSSSGTVSKVAAETVDGDKVKVKEVKTDKDLESKFVDKDAVITTIEVGEADDKVTVTYKAGKDYKDTVFYVVKLKDDQLVLLDEVKADEKGTVEVETKGDAQFTLTTMLNGWILAEDGTWYFFEEDGTPADRWLANATTWFMIEDGKMLTNTWVASSEGRWYYVGNDGSIVYNQLIDGCWINEEGIYYSPTYNK